MCLRMKRKRRFSLFSRNIWDRDTVLQKMKSKLHNEIEKKEKAELEKEKKTRGG